MRERDKSKRLRASRRGFLGAMLTAGLGALATRGVRRRNGRRRGAPAKLPRWIGHVSENERG